MKHVKEFEGKEGRTYKNLIKYNRFLTNKFDADGVVLYEENGTKHISFEYLTMTKEHINRLCEFFKNCYFYINHTYVRVRFVIDDVPDSIFEKFDEEIDLENSVKKYNL